MKMMNSAVRPEAIYPYTRNNPDLAGYAAVAAGTVVGFFAVAFLFRAFGDSGAPPVPTGVT